MKKRFKGDFDNDFVDEIRDVLDLNYMLEMKSEIENNEKTYESCLEEIESKGNSALTFLQLRQSKKNPTRTEIQAKIQKQYKDFKEFAFDMLMSHDMNLQKHEIMEVALTVSAVCLTCGRRYPKNKIKKHVNDIHNRADTSFTDVEKYIVIFLDYLCRYLKGLFG